MNPLVALCQGSSHSVGVFAGIDVHRAEGKTLSFFSFFCKLLMILPDNPLREILFCANSTFIMKLWAREGL